MSTIFFSLTFVFLLVIEVHWFMRVADVDTSRNSSDEAYKFVGFLHTNSDVEILPESWRHQSPAFDHCETPPADMFIAHRRKIEVSRKSRDHLKIRKK